MQRATSARNSIANAVLRANSGQRDSRNGQAMSTGESLQRFCPCNPLMNIQLLLSSKESLRAGTVRFFGGLICIRKSPLNYAGLIAQVDKIQPSLAEVAHENEGYTNPGQGHGMANC